MTAVKNSFHYLSTKGLMILKFIGFILIYQIAVSIIEAAPLDAYKSTSYTLLIYGIALTAFCLSFTIWRYRKQLKANNPFHFKRKPVNTRAIITLVLLFITMMAIQMVWTILVSKQIISEPSNQKEVEATLKSSPIINYIIVGIIGPIFEEVIFRGIFFNYFFKLTNGLLTQIIGVIVCSGVFGFMHTLAFNVNWIFYSLLGVVLSSTYLIFKDIRYDTALHMINNLI